MKANSYKPLKILVISHDASLTGAPVLLLHTIKLLKERGCVFNAVIRKNGPLREAFEKECERCSVVPEYKKEKLIKKVKRMLSGRQFGAIRLKELLRGVNIVLSNTITNGDILEQIKEIADVPIISYIHELNMVTKLCTTPEALEKVFLHTRHFLVDSEAVKTFLMLEHYVPADTISIVKSYTLPAAKASTAAVKQFAIEKKLSASFIVGAIAQPQWRKGTEIFILVAAQVFRKKPDAGIQFAWMGGLNTYMNFIQMKYDLEKMQLKEKVVLIESSPNIQLLIDNLDLFFLSSREDPYPLVVLDAASAAIPTVCFKNAGGAPDFVAADAGTVVNYLDIEAMADAIIHYYDNPAFLRQHGQRAAEKVAELHHDKDFISRQFFDVFATVQGGVAKNLPA